MVARRVASFFVAVLMLHQSFVGADVACARHGSKADAGQPPAAAHQHARGASMHGETSAAEKPPCEIPSQPDCCQALASCGPSVALTTHRWSRSVAVGRGVISPPTPRAALSLVFAPDPPPPKA